VRTEGAALLGDTSTLKTDLLLFMTITNVVSKKRVNNSIRLPETAKETGESIPAVSVASYLTFLEFPHLPIGFPFLLSYFPFHGHCSMWTICLNLNTSTPGQGEGGSSKKGKQITRIEFCRKRAPLRSPVPHLFTSCTIQNKIQLATFSLSSVFGAAFSPFWQEQHSLDSWGLQWPSAAGSTDGRAARFPEFPRVYLASAGVADVECRLLF